MFTLLRLLVHSFDIDFMDIWWELDGPENMFEDYSFFLARSESQLGPWTDFVVGPYKDRYRYRDNTAKMKNSVRNLWYRLEVRKDSDGSVVFVSDPECMQSPANLEAQEITRRFSLALRAVLGREMIVYPIRTFGSRCICWDITRGRSVRENCRDCFGVGFAGGFLSPFRTYLQKDPNVKSLLLTDRGSSNDQKTTMRALPYPILKPGDVVIERENQRWVVMTATNTERLGSPVHTELQLDGIRSTDILYTLPVKLDSEDFLAVPRRNLADFTDVAYAKPEEREFDHALSVYGTWYL